MFVTTSQTRLDVSVDLYHVDSFNPVKPGSDKWVCREKQDSHVVTRNS